ncbi:adenosinetriphosphatase [[Emmonsia] crescens]|uniref:Adenosinetriphosphatase n=1 Tax=[Emmonsia] crescens TaxID=73230 RepID=A0A0G2I6E4_9EURO|nr:adenosinetriphosphatase [Emmonsia crescens UAMH 3008]
MRSKPSSAMQKTYDECYLMCSTAVFFEGQNNEAEALRSWRSALNTLHHHNAYRMPSNYVPKTETEKALYDSLRELELQCKERIDLLIALNESRKEAGYQKAGPSVALGEQESGKVQVNGQNAASSASTTPGWLADGTVPSFTYSQLSRPPLRAPPPVPNRRPSMPQRFSGESLTRRRSSGEPAYGRSSTSPFPSPPVLSAPSANTLSRTSSPEKRTMLTTLRTKEPKKSASLKDKDYGERAELGPAASASRAAGLAWSSLSRLSKSGAVTTTPKRNPSVESSSRKGYFSSSDLPRQTKTSHLSDYLQSSSSTGLQQQLQQQSRSPQPGVSSSLAADAAATAIHSKPSNSELLIDLSEPSPPVSRITANTRGQSPSTSTSFLPPRPKQQPDFLTYLDKHLEAGLPSEYGNTPTQRNNPFSTSQPQLSRHDTGEGYMTPLRPATSSTTPVTQNRSRGPSYSNHRSPVGNDDALYSAISSMRASTAHTSTTVQGKRPERSGAEFHSQPNNPLSPKQQTSPDTAECTRSVEYVMKNLPKGIDENAARQILNDIVVRGDEVRWDDVAGLEVAKNALKEAVVYPFLRPDLFSGLREPARGMLLFGPPGTGKTMLARAVATESHSTFFSVSASSLTSKWHGESEKLVRALFGLAKCMAPSIIFVDEIDSLLSARSGSGEAEVSRRTKTEFLIQWSDLQRAAAGREQSEKEKRDGDPSRVLVLAATNMPWDIDEAARRRFVRRQYIPLPEAGVRKMQFERLLSHQKHELSSEDIEVLVRATDGFSGSDITALAKDAAMGPLRNLGEALLHTPMDQIRPIRLADFQASLSSIRPSVSRDGLKEHEEWAKEFGERGG